MARLRRSSRAILPRRCEAITGVPAADVRAAARLYATGGNGAIYYGLGVTEHSQGSTMVMGIANLAMATGNVGREGVGVNPLRGQNNVQGSCDMGSFPHEFPGYRHVSDDAVRALSSRAPGACRCRASPACAFRTCSRRRSTGSSRACTSRARTSPSPIPTPSTSPRRSTSMECIIVQDLFLNESAKFAHVFLPGSSFLEKDGTFTNAERRISRVRKVMEPKARLRRLGDHAAARQCPRLPDELRASRREIMDEIARLTPTFTGVSFARIDELGSIQWPCNAQHPDGTPTMHVGEFVRGKGKFLVTEYVPTSEKVNAKYPLILTTGRILSQYNVGAQTRRTENNRWHEEDRLEIHPHDAEERGIARRRLGRHREPRRRHGAARARHRAGAAGRGLHHVPFPGIGGQCDHHG